MRDKTVKTVFGPTSGVILGWIGIVLCAFLGATFAAGSSTLVGARWVIGALLAAGLIWCVMLRPRIAIQAPDRLVLRNTISTWLVPLVSVEAVEIRAMTSVRTAEGTFHAVAVGKPRKRRTSSRFLGFVPMLSGGVSPDPVRADGGSARAKTPTDLAEVVTTLILGAADTARHTGQQSTPVRRIWAVPELAVLGALAIALIVACLL